MAVLDTVFRIDPGPGNQPVGVLNVTDPSTGSVNNKLNRSVLTSGLVSLLPIASGVSTPGLYPQEGATTVGSSSPVGSTTVTLPGIPLSPVGLLIAITGPVGNPAVGQIRKITSYVTSIATVSVGWTTALTSGTNTYALLVDCTWAQTAYVQSAFSAANTNTAVIQLVYYDNPVGAIAPNNFMDLQITLDNYGYTTPQIIKPAFFAGRGYSQGAGGFIGFKVQLVTPPASSTLALSAGAS